MRRIRRDPAMLGAPVHERIRNDAYMTIDPRCVEHLAKVWPLKGRPFVEPMAGRGDLMGDIENHGGICLAASDLYEYPDQDKRIVTGADIFDDETRWWWADGTSIITNPPYGIQRDVVRHILDVAPQAWLAILCRSSQLHVKDMRPLLTNGRLWGVAPLPFRPWWHPKSGEATATPRHEFAWFIWAPTWAAGEPRLLL